MADLERYPEGDAESILAYRLTRPVLPHVLIDELQAEVGAEATMHLAFEGDIAAASEEQPVIIYLPEEVNLRQLNRVLAQHDPNPPPHEMDVIRAKLANDEPLLTQEVFQALKYLLGA
jgi:hypothetical protein